MKKHIAIASLALLAIVLGSRLFKAGVSPLANTSETSKAAEAPRTPEKMASNQSMAPSRS